MQTALIIIHVIVSIVLVLVVLMQHGKQQGLSGAIAGGAETFFGKNKGRTIDAMLKKLTSVVAVLFVVSSIALAVYSINENKAKTPETPAVTEQETNNVQGRLDENGNFVDANGNILLSAEDFAKAQELADENAAKEAEKQAE